MLLYIDPGTGSMLFTIMIGVFGAALYSLRLLYMKLKFSLSGGRQKDASGDKKPIVIFTDDKRYWSVFEPVCRELDKRKIRVTYMTASPDDPGLKNPYEYVDGEFIGKGNRAFARMNFLNANIVLSTTPGLDVYQWKRSKTVDHYVHIPHAASDIVLYRMFGLDYYDSVFLSGDYQETQIRKLEKKWGLPEKELIKVGIPYMDSMRERLIEAGGAVKNRKTTVLLAPSWGENAILSVYGGRIIDALKSSGFHIIIRPHPQSFTSEKEMIDSLMDKYPESEDLEWNRDNDNFDVLRRSDIMISDFSGVIFDFTLIHDKPVIYTDTEFDKGVYDAWWLDDPLWTFEILPSLGMKLTEEGLMDIGELVNTCISDNRFSEGRERARKETWMYMGSGAENVADHLAAKYNELQERLA